MEIKCIADVTEITDVRKKDLETAEMWSNMGKVESNITPRLWTACRNMGKRNIRRHFNKRVRHFRVRFRKTISRNAVFE